MARISLLLGSEEMGCVYTGDVFVGALPSTV
jgi:hypothetical protein